MGGNRAGRAPCGMRPRRVGAAIILLFFHSSLSSQGLLPPLPPGEARYTVQLAAFETEGEASQEALRFQQLGLTPVFAAPIDYWPKVFFGLFDYYADATLQSRAIREAGLAESFVVNLAQLPAEAVPAEPGENVGRLGPVFNLEVPNAAAMPVAILRGNATYEELERIDREQSDTAYRSALLAELPNHAPADPLAGYIHVNLGSLDMRDQSYDSALAHFWLVANGEIASAAAHRVMAMRRIAWIIHNVQGDRLRAYQAYSEIERFTGSEAVRATCLTERAGLLMELARSSKGQIEESRDLCERALTVLSESQAQPRALLRLMRMETFAHEGRDDVALAEASALAEELRGRPETQREYFMALVWIGRNAASLNEFNIVRSTAERILSEAADDTPCFAGFPVRAEGMLLLAQARGSQGDREAARTLLQAVMASYPGTRTAQMAQLTLNSFERNWRFQSGR
jgi:tetratricopeptide (TPR) repeat protein